MWHFGFAEILAQISSSPLCEVPVPFLRSLLWSRMLVRQWFIVG